MSNHWPYGFEVLVNSSYKIRQEIETHGGIQTFTPYVPTDLTVEDDEILGGWDESKGSCPQCFMLRSANGSCNCSESVRGSRGPLVEKK